MAKRIITRAELPEVLNRLREHYRLFAPVRQQQMSNFEELHSGERADFSQANTRLSPKALMLPQSELMFEFSTEGSRGFGGILQEIDRDSRPRAIFGIRPCDARAFVLLDLNFDTPDCRDPWWSQRRQLTTLVGLGCNHPRSTCFCTSVGGGPFDRQGLDLLLTDLGDEILAEILTDKGEELLAHAGVEKAASEAVVGAARALQQRARERISSRVPTERLGEQELLQLFNAPFWEQVQFACINCGVCTFVCPTCWCFDIQDELQRGQGVRLRNWDSCMFPLFTLHGSGHNPRAQKLQRLRQRFMHKLKYFLDKYHQGVACVGCGRCVQLCPVNIDIREIFRLMNDFV